jgi:tetratricopeptide (TPR) repeat protein
VQGEVADALKLFDAGRCAEAVALLRSVAEKDPKNPIGWRDLGAMLSRCEDFVGSIEAYTRATWLIGRDANTWAAMAVAAFRLGRHKDSVAYWRSALEADPQYFDKYTRFSVLWEESRQHYSEFTELVRRLSKRTDPASCFLLLDAVVSRVDAADALRTLTQYDDSASAPMAIAATAIRLSGGESAAARELLSHLRPADLMHDDVFVQRICRWVAERSGQDLDDNMMALMQPDAPLSVARACYVLAPDTGDSLVASLDQILSGVLSALRTLSAAA